ncbi:MAG: hypothetical protein R2848_12885 [Thermomicrobiales bacterium]
MSSRSFRWLFHRVLTYRGCAAIRVDALFEQRAQAVRPDFSISPENVETVAEICIRLDGLPLAIELAAARVKILSPRRFCLDWSTGSALLSRDGRDVPDRLRTMRRGRLEL